MKKAGRNKVFYVVVVLLCVAAVLLLSQGVEAALFRVNSTDDSVDAAQGDGICATAGGVCTLRAAVQEANALAGADEIRLKAAVYRLTLTGADEDLAATGDLDITDSLTIRGKGAALTVVDGNHSDRVFHVIGPGPVVSFIGLKIQNGAVLSGFAAGGGILNGNSLGSSGATVIVSGCTISNNSAMAQMGGGIASSGGSLKIVSSRVTQNRLYYEGDFALGGGIASFADASLKIKGTKVANNFVSNIADTADPDDTALGAGIAIVGTSAVRIASSKITGNIADSLTPDTYASSGGGLYMAGVPSAQIIDTMIAYNTATGYFGIGGGVFAAGSQATFSGCTVMENSADGRMGGIGGGMYLEMKTDPVTITIDNLSTVTNNFAASGGGIYKSGAVTLNVSTDSVVAGNLQDDIFP